MFSTKILIQEINLDSISFILDPEIDPITNNDLKVFLNDNEFYEYDLIAIDTSSNKLYKIIPHTNFLLQDILDFKINKEDINSNFVKIIFLTQLEDGFKFIPFKIYLAEEGKYIFTLNKYNSIDTNITSYPLMAIKPLDLEKCEAWTEYPNYSYGEIIHVYFKLINEDGNPVPKGFYEVEIE
ncbi:hypothetical protein [Clostridium sp. KNHs214]|uniref:hypothetical protein n=1 Tax=Clostridium sp. KNHs214 TaxID=1540257 RepID=UPI000556F2E1|nr:hypothetical protein [Clostridium sp. KNHs214]